MLSGQTPVINGKFLYYAFLAGGNNILQHQLEINQINVFPVHDRDTGTNMASTIRSVIDSVQPHKSYKIVVNSIAEAALLGARGNSGVIFAQFLHGLNCETADKNVINLAEFVESVCKSIPYIYEAIANPVEGTMLTVIREWSEFLSSKKNAVDEFKSVILESMSVLEKSLDETATRLKALNDTGFVDAGAKSFVLFLQGIIHFIKKRNIRKLSNGYESISLIHTEDLIPEKLTYRYCTEALLKDLVVEQEKLQNVLALYGDSVVVAGSKKMSRIHVHSSKPAELFDTLKEFGTISYQKVDDMVRQNEVVTNRKWNVALVTDSTCDLSDDLIEKYQINRVPINLSFGENYYLDKLTVHPKQFYSLLESSTVFPKTSQINEQVFTNLYSHLASHYDAVIAIHLTSQFSGTYSNSKKAGKRISEEFGKPVYVIDSKNLSGGLGLLVLKAAKLIEKGETAKQAVNAIEKDISATKIYVSVKNLKYMIMGGRVSKPKGFVANLFGLNPVISMAENGKSLLFGKTFSQKASLKRIYQHIRKIARSQTIWNYVLLHAHNPEGAEEVRQEMLMIAGKEPVSIVDISPVIGMHAGHGAVAVSLMFNLKTTEC